MKEKGHMGPTKKQNVKSKKWEKQTIGEKVCEEKKRFFFFIFFSFLSQIHGNIERTKSVLRDEGYAWVPKSRDFTKNSGKNSEISKFLVFLRFTAF